MRIANSLERTSKNLAPKMKYYIIPEGDVTEKEYFEGIRVNMEEINNNALIEIVVIVND